MLVCQISLVITCRTPTDSIELRVCAIRPRFHHECLLINTKTHIREMSYLNLSRVLTGAEILYLAYKTSQYKNFLFWFSVVVTPRPASPFSILCVNEILICNNPGFTSTHPAYHKYTVSRKVFEMQNNTWIEIWPSDYAKKSAWSRDRNRKHALSLM